MKAKLLLLASALFAAAAQAAERLAMDQLPSPVRRALGTSAANERVKEITIRSVDGRAVYDVEIERENAPNARLRVAADGSVLHDSRRGAIASSSADAVVSSSEFGTPVYVPRLKLDELPPAAQQTIRKEASGREIDAITSDAVDGRTAYRVEFRERGRNPSFYVAEDGTLLRPTEKTPVLGLGTSFGQTPAPVQETLRREVGTGEIVKIDKEGRQDDTTSYKVEVKNSQGTFELHVSETGNILQDTRRSSGR